MNKRALNYQPIVSVVVPVHNAEEFLFETLNNLLSESRIPIEVVVVNDHSTDRSLCIAQEFVDNRIKIINTDLHGIAPALNIGLKVAHGEYFMRCDADDLYAVERIYNQVDWMSQNPEYGAICGGFSATDKQGNIIKELTQFNSESLEITNELLNGVVRTSFCTFATRTSVLRQLGGFRNYFKTSEDIDMQFRIAEVCRVWYQSGTNYFWRIHNSSITHSQPNFERIFYENRAREFQLQRIQEGEDDLTKGIFILPEMDGENKFFSADQHLCQLLIGQAWQEYSLGNFKNSWRLGFKGLMYAPLNINVWRSFLGLLLKYCVERSHYGRRA